MTDGQTRWLVIATHVGHDGSGGGMVRYAVEMVRALGEVDSVEPHVLTRRAGAPFFAELLGGEQRVHVVPNAPTMAISALECTGVAIPSLRHGFDVVHGTKHFVPRFSAAHRVLTVHDMLLLDRPRDYSAVKRVAVKRPYLSSIAHAESLICVSEATRERLRAFTPRAAARSDVVRSAVSTSLVDAEPRAVDRLEGRRFALVVGDPSPRKNLRLLVDNWGRVTERVPDAVLAIAGPAGWGLADLGDAYASLVASGQVVALGHVPDDQLRWCYEHAVVVLCPSLHEGFGLPAVEALAFASALITSDDPALREVSDGRAVHVPVDDPGGWVDAIAARFAGTPPTPRPAVPPEALARRRERHRGSRARTAAIRAPTGVTAERIGSVLLLFEPPDGGVAENVLELARGMRARGWVPTVAGPVVSSVRSRLEDDGIEYLELPHLRRGYGRPADDARALVWLRRLLRARRFDVLHAHSAKAGMLARVAAARSGVPCLYSPHCFGFVGDVSARRRLFAITAERLAGPATTAIICCCEAERTRAREHRLVAERKLRRVYYGVAAADPATRPHPELEAMRGDGVLIGAIAVMRPQKRLDLLVAVAPEILARFPEARIVIVGNGPLDEDLRRQTRELGLDSDARFRIVPFEPPSSRYLRSLDIFVLPSSWEAMPIGVLEALAHGVAQVATDVEGTGEEVVPETGILIPAKDRTALAQAICELLESPSRRAAAATASRERHRERFGLERMLEETTDIYAEAARVESCRVILARQHSTAPAVTSHGVQMRSQAIA